jgi:hypothetical protein
MLLFLLSVWLSLDCGSAFTKASFATKSDRIEVGLNPQGQAGTATAFAFRPRAGFNFTNPKDLQDTEGPLVIPEIGERALKLAEVRPTFVGAHFPDLIDLNDTYVRQRAGQLHTEIRIGRAIFRDAVAVFYATFIDSIKKDRAIEDVVVVVPATYTYHQREHLKFALDAVGYSRVSMIDDVNAAAIVFANERPQKFASERHTVLFVDVGGAAVRGYLLRFESSPAKSGRSKRATVTRLSYVCDYDAGGILLTLSIQAKMKKEFGYESYTKADDHRMTNAAERLKVFLTRGEEVATVVVEVHGEDRKFQMTRDEFAQIVEPYVAKAVEVAKAASGDIRPDSVEVIGGGAKMGQMIAGLSAGLGRQVWKAFDPDTTLAKGGAYFAQFAHGVRLFPEVSIEEPNPLVSVSLLTGDRTVKLCERGRSCTLQAMVDGKAKIFSIAVDPQDLRPGLRTTTFGFLYEKQPGPINVTFSYPPFAVAGCQYCNTSGCTPVNLQPSREIPRPSDLAAVFGTNESVTRYRQRAMKRTLDLAGRVLEEAARKDGLPVFTTHPELITIIRKAEHAQKCITEYGKACFSWAQVNANITGLEKAIAPVYARISQNASIKAADALLSDTIELVLNATEFDWKKTKPFLAQQTIERLLAIVDEADEWLEEVRRGERVRDLWKFSDVGPDEYDARTLRLFRAYHRVEGMTNAPEGEWTDPFIEVQAEPLEDARLQRAQENLQAVSDRSAMMRLKGLITRKKKEAARIPDRTRKERPKRPAQQNEVEAAKPSTGQQEIEAEQDSARQQQIEAEKDPQTEVEAPTGAAEPEYVKSPDERNSPEEQLPQTDQTQEPSEPEVPADPSPAPTDDLQTGDLPAEAPNEPAGDGDTQHNDAFEAL